MAGSLKVSVLELLGWSEGAAAGLQALDNCGWAVLQDSGVDGRLRLAAWNRIAGTRFRFHSGSWLGFRELPTGATNGAVAQLVAHLHGMQGVRGSSPLSSTNTAGPWPAETLSAAFVAPTGEGRRQDPARPGLGQHG